MTKQEVASGDTLRKLRELAGLTQVEVATEADVSVAYLSRVEKGHMEPTLSYVAKVTRAIADRLGTAA